MFAENVPQVEIRGGMAFIRMGGAEIATTVANLQAFVATCNRALDCWYEDRAVLRFPPPHR